MNKQPILKNLNIFDKETFPNAESIYQRGFYIPCGLGITYEEQIKVAETLLEIEQKFI